MKGLVYGYLYYTKPSAKAMNASNGIFDIGFWAMHPDTHEKMLVGAYKSATIATDVEMQKVYTQFKERGIIQRRAEELVAVLPDMSIKKALKEITDSVREPFIKWKCPIDQVVVYESMIALPSSVNSKAVGAHFAKPTFVDYTTILPNTIGDKKTAPKTAPKENAGSTSPLAEDAYYRESARNLRTIIPRHNQLSNLFCRWLKLSGVKESVQEKGRVDVSFEHLNKSHLSELKICYGVGTTKAIREAVGQLFEYNYYSCKSPKNVWLIVLDDKPSDLDIAFIERISKLHALPIHLGWKSDETTFSFADDWKPGK